MHCKIIENHLQLQTKKKILNLRIKNAAIRICKRKFDMGLGGSFLDPPGPLEDPLEDALEENLEAPGFVNSLYKINFFLLAMDPAR